MGLRDSLAYAELRTRLAIRQIQDIRHGDHTHDHVHQILDEISDYLRENHDELIRATSSGVTEICRSRAAALIVDLDTYLPLLGFILRSSNVRNAFEVFDPLIAICGVLLGSDARLIYSSEWDYSPFTRTFTFPKLHNVVVVGLPAHESGNALIVPVVGHELGHAKWAQSDMKSQVSAEIEKAVIDYFMLHLDEVVGKKRADDIRTQTQPEAALALFIPEVGHAQYFAKLQCEEIFCDITGVRIFGASYLRAFAYLIFPSPKQHERQSFEYPSNRARVHCMKQAANYFNTAVASDFGEDFEDTLPKHLVGARRHMVLAADEATDKLLPKLLRDVDDLISDAAIPRIDQAAVERLLECFKRGRPGDGIFLLPDIIEAAWQTHETNLSGPSKDLLKSADALNEIVFKTVEVAEFYKRVGE
jgi:hypothetical protein